MRLSPKETDRLPLFLAAELARRRRADGVAPELDIHAARHAHRDARLFIT